MTLELAVDARSVLGKQTKRLRRAGNVPGVVYGKGTASIPVQVDAKQFEIPVPRRRSDDDLPAERSRAGHRARSSSRCSATR